MLDKTLFQQIFKTNFSPDIGLLARDATNQQKKFIFWKANRNACASDTFSMASIQFKSFFFSI